MYRLENSILPLYKKTKLLIGICILMIACALPQITVKAATIKIRYNGKNYSYTSSQASATLDGEDIDLKGTPGVLIDDTCMLPAYEVFRKALGASYRYDRTSKQLEITQNDISIEMTLNSKTAYINGNKVTCDVAPKQIKFKEVGKTKIYVPARFVAEALGYSYNWNSSSKTSEMKKPFVINYDGEWTIYKGTQGKVSFDGEEIDLADMPSIVIDKTSLLRASSVFKSTLGANYTYDKETKTILISQNDTTILMTIDSDVAFVNGESMTMGTKARLVYNKDNNKSYVMVPGKFVATNLGYEYSWNPTTKTSNIQTGTKVYFSQKFPENTDGQASIVSVEASCTDKMDTLTMQGNTVLDVSVKELDSTYLQLIISNINPNIVDFSQDIMDSWYLNGITIRGDGTTVVIDVYKEANCTYYTSQSGDKFQLVLCENADADTDKSGYQLKFNMPEELDFDSITTKDCYYENKFVIYLEGDYKNYFKENPIKYSNSIVKNVSTEITNNGDTAITVHTNGLKGFKLNNCGDYIGVNIANPSSIYDKIIVLDAGHGGKDNGTASKGTKEKDLNYTIIYELAKEYFDSKDSNIKAYWTRYDDTFVTLDDRAAFASKVEADVFVSLHMNAATPKAKGLEVYYSKENKHSMGSLTSQKMATIFFNQLISDLGMDKRSVKSAGFVVVKKNTVPSILIELGFLSNSSDYKKLTDPDFQDFAAQSIYDAAVALFDAYPTGR